MNCIAIDDEPIALIIIQEYCKQISDLELVASFTQTSKAEKYLKKFPVDLIFLDIHMPDINGIDFYKRIKQDTLVIFTTAHSKYAVEGFNVSAIDYLLKPIDFDRFKEGCEKAISYYSHIKNPIGKQEFLYVRSEYALVKVPFNDILYMETMDDYIKIHQFGKKPVITLMSMKKMMQKLPEKDFLRVHRSFIVSFHNIESVRSKSISLGAVDIPIGKSYEKEFLKRYTEEGY
jgi:DNA-binding LytR/AlgR family response regulator